MPMKTFIALCILMILLLVIVSPKLLMFIALAAVLWYALPKILEKIKM